MDWFVALRITGPSNPRRYAIFDSLDSSAWRETTEEVLAKQLLGQVDAKVDLLAAWNDEPPSGKEVSTTYAHAKGVLTFQTSSGSGFYYMHSIPKYPDIDTESGKINYVSPASSQYGQSMLCQTVASKSQANSILDQVSQSYPYIYFNNFASKTDSNFLGSNREAEKGGNLRPIQMSLAGLFKLGQLAKISRGAAELSKDSDAAVSTVQGQYSQDPVFQKVGPFTFVTKPRPLQEEIYEGFLSPFWSTFLKVPVGFYIETWGRPLLPSQCEGPNQMINIRTLKISGTTQLET